MRSHTWLRQVGSGLAPGALAAAAVLFGSTVGGYGDIALRDFWLMLGALTLARLATADLGRDGRAVARDLKPCQLRP